MAATLSHRGPDDEGLWQDKGVPLLLGHRRLSIIDLSPEGHQPKESHSGRYVVSYNGEIYNFPELQHELEATGVVFRGRSDTEIMLAAFDRWGVNHALQKLNGMFAFALWDRQEKKLHLIRDRLGKKPLYVGWAGRDLVFASELKAFHAHPDFPAEIDRDVLGLYMRYGWVPSPWAIYEDVWQVPPGCRLTLDVSALKAGQDLRPLFEPYWHLPRVIEESRQKGFITNEDQALNELEMTLRQCVQERMISDVPLGAFLSGGIDSSVVVALMQQLSARPVKTFTIGFNEDGFNEAEYARKVARHLGTEHNELYLGPQKALDIVPQLPAIYDEPFADESQIPTFLVSRFARESVTVALSGDGGDEMFGGYTRHLAVPALWKRAGWLPPAARRALASGVRRLSAERWNRFAPHMPRFGEKLYKAAALISERDATDIYRRLTSRWPAELVLGASRPAEKLDDPAYQLQNLHLTEILIYNDTLNYLPDDVLVKVDRASMAVSLEARAPLLDKRIAEFAWRLPLQMKIRGGKGKWILRQLLLRYLPGDLYERPKQGFSVPIGAWLQGPLKDWAEDLLDESRLRQDNFIDPAPVLASWEAFKGGQHHNAYALWNVLMFQAWYAHWRTAGSRSGVEIPVAGRRM